MLLPTLSKGSHPNLVCQAKDAKKAIEEAIIAACDENVDLLDRLATLKRVINENAGSISDGASIAMLKNARACRDRLAEEARRAAKKIRREKVVAFESQVPSSPVPASCACPSPCCCQQ